MFNMSQNKSSPKLKKEEKDTPLLHICPVSHRLQKCEQTLLSFM